MSLMKFFGLNQHHVRVCRCHHQRRQANDFAAPEIFLIPGHCGRIRQNPGDGRAELFDQYGEQPVTDAIANEGQVGVGAIFAPARPLFEEIPLDIATRAVQHRPDQSGLRNWPDAAQSGGAGAAEQAVQDGLCLVGPGMAGGNAVHNSRPADLIEERNSRIAARLLEIRFIGFSEVQRLDRAGPAKPSCQVRDKPGVLVRFLTSQPVVDVEHVKAYVEPGSEVIERVKQPNGIGTTRDSHAGRSAAREHAVRFNRPANLLEHILL